MVGRNSQKPRRLRSAGFPRGGERAGPVWRKQLIRMTPQLLARMNEPWPTPWIREIAFTHEN